MKRKLLAKVSLSNSSHHSELASKSSKADASRGSSISTFTPVSFYTDKPLVPAHLLQELRLACKSIVEETGPSDAEYKEILNTQDPLEKWKENVRTDVVDERPPRPKAAPAKAPAVTFNPRQDSAGGVQIDAQSGLPVVEKSSVYVPRNAARDFSKAYARKSSSTLPYNDPFQPLPRTASVITAATSATSNTIILPVTSSVPRKLQPILTDDESSPMISPTISPTKASNHWNEIPRKLPSLSTTESAAPMATFPLPNVVHELPPISALSPMSTSESALAAAPVPPINVSRKLPPITTVNSVPPTASIPLVSALTPFSQAFPTTPPHLNPEARVSPLDDISFAPFEALAPFTTNIAGNSDYAIDNDEKMDTGDEEQWGAGEMEIERDERMVTGAPNIEDNFNESTIADIRAQENLRPKTSAVACVDYSGLSMTSADTSSSTTRSNTTYDLVRPSTGMSSAALTPGADKMSYLHHESTRSLTGAMAPRGELTAKAWMAQELARRRELDASRDASNFHSRAGSNVRSSSVASRRTDDERPQSRAGSIRDGIRDYIRPRTSTDSLRSRSSSTSSRFGGSSSHGSWWRGASSGLRRKGSFSSFRSMTKPEDEEEGRGRDRGPDLNRSLPPLPGLDQYKEEKKPRMHISQLMSRSKTTQAVVPSGSSGRVPQGNEHLWSGEQNPEFPKQMHREERRATKQEEKLSKAKRRAQEKVVKEAMYKAGKGSGMDAYREDALNRARDEQHRLSILQQDKNRKERHREVGHETNDDHPRGGKGKGKERARPHISLQQSVQSSQSGRSHTHSSSQPHSISHSQSNSNTSNLQSGSYQRPELLHTASSHSLGRTVTTTGPSPMVHQKSAMHESVTRDHHNRTTTPAFGRSESSFGNRTSDGGALGQRFEERVRESRGLKMRLSRLWGGEKKTGRLLVAN